MSFVSCFKYLGHIIDSSMSDDADIDREIKKLFTTTNLLLEDSPDVQLLSSLTLLPATVLCDVYRQQ